VSQDHESPSEIATLIGDVERGDAGSADRLFNALYGELHRLSKRALARHGSAVSLSATSLLHEAYLDIAGRSVDRFPDAARFMGYAARVMRGLIINYARNRQALKRGGAFELTSITTNLEPYADASELTRIGESLDELATIDASLAAIVDLKFFCGFSFAEIARMQQTSERTVQRKWERARIYLYQSLQPL
jgi:RNA polymerase sigma factor (TIGR02999 family)